MTPPWWAQRPRTPRPAPTTRPNRTSKNELIPTPPTHVTHTQQKKTVHYTYTPPNNPTMKHDDDIALTLFTWAVSLVVGTIFLGLVSRGLVYLFCLGYGC